MKDIYKGEKYNGKNRMITDKWIKENSLEKWKEYVYDLISNI